MSPEQPAYAGTLPTRIADGAGSLPRKEMTRPSERIQTATASNANGPHQLRYNALRALDPDVLVRHLDAFARGDICGLERVLDEFERREDKMSIGAFKMSAAVLAMAKRLSWNDWLLFSEKYGMPVILGNTNAQIGTEAWAAMARAIRAVAPKTGLLADTGTTLSAVPMGAGGQTTYRELVDTVDRAISALYCGGDLATVSAAPDAAGVNA